MSLLKHLLEKNLGSNRVVFIVIALVLIGYFPELRAETLEMPQIGSSILVAQAENDDTYDPFADYSEFEEEADEEADINFFRHGRFFSLGFLAGYRGITDSMANIVTGGVGYGLFINYFFDLRFALQVSFMSSNHDIKVSSANTTSTGTVAFSNLALNLKYYFNTQNVTKGLADLNPYIIGGFSQVYRTVSIDDNEAFAKDATTGLDIGAGIEWPMLRNKMFFGGQVAYQLVSYKDENKEIILNDVEKTGARLRGDIYTVLGILGVNF